MPEIEELPDDWVEPQPEPVPQPQAKEEKNVKPEDDTDDPLLQRTRPLKVKGNEAFKAGDYEEAVDLYSQALNGLKDVLAKEREERMKRDAEEAKREEEEEKKAKEEEDTRAKDVHEDEAPDSGSAAAAEIEEGDEKAAKDKIPENMEELDKELAEMMKERGHNAGPTSTTSDEDPKKDTFNGVEMPKKANSGNRKPPKRHEPTLYEKEAAIYLGNRAACHARLEDDESCLKDCDQCIHYDPKHVKARMRRAAIKERQEKYIDALGDYKAVKEYQPTYPGIDAKIRSIAPAAAAEEERLKTEMMGQLKDIGNKFLGMFGLSTDNFEMQQGEGGGYSINFKQ
eukprot:Clim_evm17s232 gene=Clim_evmTU17s232